MHGKLRAPGFHSEFIKVQYNIVKPLNITVGIPKAVSAFRINALFKGFKLCSLCVKKVNYLKVTVRGNLSFAEGTAVL